MTRDERLLNDAKSSIKTAYDLMSRVEDLNRESIQRIINCANQASQASKELNQLVGSLTTRFLGD